MQADDSSFALFGSKLLPLHSASLPTAKYVWLPAQAQQLATIPARCLQAKTYKNKALSALFLMNNVHYMVKTVESSPSLAVIGEEWIEQHKDQVSMYLNLASSEGCCMRADCCKVAFLQLATCLHGSCTAHVEEVQHACSQLTPYSTNHLCF